MLTPERVMELWQPFAGFPVGWIEGFARAIERECAAVNFAAERAKLEQEWCELQAMKDQYRRATPPAEAQMGAAPAASSNTSEWPCRSCGCNYPVHAGNCANAMAALHGGAHFVRIEAASAGLSDDVVERAAKALERHRMIGYEWTDEQFDVWWNKDDRRNRTQSIEHARVVLLAALSSSPVEVINGVRVASEGDEAVYKAIADNYAESSPVEAGAVAYQETDVYWKPLDSFSSKSDAFAYKRPLYVAPQAAVAQALTDAQIRGVYHEATGQVTRPQDERLVFAFARAILARSAQSQPMTNAARDVVGYVNSDELDNVLDDRTAIIQGRRDGFRRTPIYRAPQKMISDEDKKLLIEAWNYGQFSDDYDIQQSKPVRAALRRLCAEIERIDRKGDDRG